MRRTIVAFATLIALTALLVIPTRALAVFARSADQGIQITKACPDAVSFDVAAIGPSDGSTPATFTVDIRAVTPAPDRDPNVPFNGTVVLEKPVELPRLSKPIEIIFSETDSLIANYLGSFTLPWDGGQVLAPGTTVAIGTPESLESRQFAEATIAADCGTPTLELTSVCGKTTKKKLTWRVHNPNPFPVDFTWRVRGTDQTGSGTAPADGDTRFKTRRVAGPNTTKLFVNGQKVDVEDACLRRHGGG
jgi:hypothetical protein